MSCHFAKQQRRTTIKLIRHGIQLSKSNLNIFINGRIFSPSAVFGLIDLMDSWARLASQIKGRSKLTDRRLSSHGPPQVLLGGDEAGHGHAAGVPVARGLLAGTAEPRRRQREGPQVRPQLPPDLEAVRLPARVLQRGPGRLRQQARGVPAAPGAHRVGHVPVPGDEGPLPAHGGRGHAAEHPG